MGGETVWVTREDVYFSLFFFFIFWATVATYIYTPLNDTIATIIKAKT